MNSRFIDRQSSRPTLFSPCTCGANPRRFGGTTLDGHTDNCLFRKYRYTLWREWEQDMFAITEYSVTSKLNHYVQFIGLNPSTADEVQDDPTIRRCIDFAKTWGFGGYCMTNLFAWRETNPKLMKRVPEPIGPDNDQHILAMALTAGLVVCAWGKDGSHMERGNAVVKMLLSNNVKLVCLKKNQDGSPIHPLYVKGDTKPISYP